MRPVPHKVVLRGTGRDLSSDSLVTAGLIRFEVIVPTIIKIKTAILAVITLCATVTPSVSKIKQCKIVSQSEVVSTGEMVKEALGVIGSGTLLVLSIRKGTPSIALAAEGAVTLKEMVGLAPHLSHAVQLQRLRTFFGLGEDDKLEICPTGNSIASGMGFSNVAMVGRAPKSPVTNSTSSQGAPLTTGDAFQPYKMDISNALKRFDRPNDTPISITAKSLLSPKDTQGLTLGKPLTLEAIDKGDLLKAYKPPASITDKFLIASFTGTLRGIVLATD